MNINGRKLLAMTSALAALLLGVAGLWAAPPAQPDLSHLLPELDRLTNFQTDFTSVYTEVTAHPGQPQNVVQHTVYRRNRDGSMTIIMLAPQSKKGQGYVEVSNNFWFYDPASRLFSHASLKENWLNTEAMNSDFFRTNWATDYAIEDQSEGTLGVYPVYILELKGANDQVTFPFKKIWVRKDISIVLKAEDYSLSRRLMRTVYYPEYTRIGEQYVATRMLMVDALNVGSKTQMTLTDLSTAALPDFTFTKAFLQQVNR